ncbi:DUF1311 domain-containing protein [Flavobacterium sp. ACN6]|uniref:DUF1311 domain-containing protein n=1 Tax=Flavobacterium sp. ACN6 TaxID=1920426 RepID=UPI000BB2F695|nr:DUF1311 domain-containing protein [Flavobacterium sp. ACN6]PBJ12295.1 hypothetical protein BSF42_22500 [Flavobacterium sp. ACN6]
MKRGFYFSIVLNLILIVLCFFLYQKEIGLEKELFSFQKGKKVHEKEKKENHIEMDKNDPIFIFNSKKFACDSGGSSSYETNLCFGEKLEFADSLLTEVFKNKILLLDKYVKMDKEVISKTKDNTFFVKALRLNTAQKENLIKSQKLWDQMRVLNSKDVELACDGGTGCSGFVSRAETNYVLKRIEEIKNINGYN